MLSHNRDQREADFKINPNITKNTHCILYLNIHIITVCLWIDLSGPYTLHVPFLLTTIRSPFSRIGVGFKFFNVEAALLFHVGQRFGITKHISSCFIYLGCQLFLFYICGNSACSVGSPNNVLASSLLNCPSVSLRR